MAKNNRYQYLMVVWTESLDDHYNIVATRGPLGEVIEDKSPYCSVLTAVKDYDLAINYLNYFLRYLHDLGCSRKKILVSHFQRKPQACSVTEVLENDQSL